jgi:hypothetical protein
MRELTADEKTFLEELLVNVKEVEKLVWDDTKTDNVKSMILQIGCEANGKRDASESHERVQIKIARHAKARGDAPSPRSQPSLFLTSMYGIAGSGANMCEGRNKASGGVTTTRRVPHSKLQGQFGS